MSGSVTIGIPHYQAKSLLIPCLRSIRKHSQRHEVTVIVVDNGSKDDSLDYLRNLAWIELIERPEETPANFLTNVFTAWDECIRRCNTDYFITMHADVFIKNDDWLDAFFSRFDESPQVAAVGGWKLTLEPRWYEWQKRIFANLGKRVRGRELRDVEALYGQFPRDYCAMYRVKPIVESDYRFAKPTEFSGGLQISLQLRDGGFEHRMIPLLEMAQNLVHARHGGVAVAGLQLKRKGRQKQAERHVANLFAEPWVQTLYSETQWDE